MFTQQHYRSRSSGPVLERQHSAWPELKYEMSEFPDDDKWRDEQGLDNDSEESRSTDEDETLYEDSKMNLTIKNENNEEQLQENNQNNTTNTNNSSGPKNNHSDDESIAPFVEKLWKMVNDPVCDNAIRWYGDDAIMLVDFTALERILKNYFTSSKLASFIRQLNTYEFHKLGTKGKSTIFKNDHFRKNYPLLGAIRRQQGLKRRASTSKHRGASFEGKRRRRRRKDNNNNLERRLQWLKLQNQQKTQEIDKAELVVKKRQTELNQLVNFLKVLQNCDPENVREPPTTELAKFSIFSCSDDSRVRPNQ